MMTPKKKALKDKPMNWLPTPEDRDRMRKLQARFALKRPSDAIRTALKLAVEQETVTA